MKNKLLILSILSINIFCAEEKSFLSKMYDLAAGSLAYGARAMQIRGMDQADKNKELANAASRLDYHAMAQLIEAGADAQKAEMVVRQRVEVPEPTSGVEAELWRLEDELHDLDFNEKLAGTTAEELRKADIVRKYNEKIKEKFKEKRDAVAEEVDFKKDGAREKASGEAGELGKLGEKQIIALKNARYAPRFTSQIKGLGQIIESAEPEEGLEAEDLFKRRNLCNTLVHNNGGRQAWCAVCGISQPKISSLILHGVAKHPYFSVDDVLDSNLLNKRELVLLQKKEEEAKEEEQRRFAEDCFVVIGDNGEECEDEIIDDCEIKEITHLSALDCERKRGE